MLTFIPITDYAEIGGHNFRVSALPCGIVRRHVMPLLEAIQARGILDGDNYDQVVKICHMSLSQAMPDLALEDLENGLMVNDVADLFQAVVKVSGLSRGGGEGEAQGQGRTGEALIGSGATFTESSQQQQDGHGPTLTHPSPSPQQWN